MRFDDPILTGEPQAVTNDPRLLAGGGPEALVRAADVLLRRAVSAIEVFTAHNLRADQLVGEALEAIVQTRNLVDESRSLRSQLRDAISELARYERRRDTPPEKVVTLLKRLVLDAEAERLRNGDAQSLIDEVVRWGIEAYYGA